MALIAWLRALLGVFGRDGLTVQDVVDAVGPVARDPGVPMPMSLRPSAPDVRSASLARYPDSGAPYLLTLELEPSLQPCVADLVDAFGPYRRAGSDRGMPVPLVFEPPAEASRWTVALVAELPAGSAPSDSARAESVALRRDPVAARPDLR
ncbi:MAG TPA: hypothetical protein VEL75_23775 [Candidatus Methylomirabilis sp.]|nr:hypothetical protein [Candidatus Methylomirabilis sp.]